MASSISQIPGGHEESSLNFWWDCYCQREKYGPYTQRIVVQCFDLSDDSLKDLHKGLSVFCLTWSNRRAWAPSRECWPKAFKRMPPLYEVIDNSWDKPLTYQNVWEWRVWEKVTWGNKTFKTFTYIGASRSPHMWPVLDTCSGKTQEDTNLLPVADL